MHASVENVGALERRLTVRFPAVRLDTQVRQRMAELGRTVRLNGFRPGKVPPKVIEQRFGAQVRGEALSELIGKTFEEAATQYQLRPVANPSISTSGAPEGGEIAYTATFEVMPELPVVDVSVLEIERVRAEATDADVDHMIETLRQQRRRFQPVERVAREGDFVAFDYSAQTSEGRYPEQGSERAGSVLGSGSLMQEMDAAMLGHGVGATLELDVAFPSEFRNPALAGKLAQVRLSIAEVREPMLPEIDADFIRGFGIIDGELAKFRSEVRANLERELRGALLARLKGEVAQKLAAAYPGLDLPKVMVEAEAQAIARMGLPQGSEPAAEMVVAAHAPARLRVAAALLMGEIARRNNITADGKRVAEMLAAIASTYEEPQRVVELYRNDPQLMEGLRNRVLEDQVAEWVAEHARVVDKTMSFDELLRPGRAG